MCTLFFALVILLFFSSLGILMQAEIKEKNKHKTYKFDE
jgi:hypothetical protein